MICPRCDSKNANLLVQSPVGNEWKMYICNECNFTWRSTESESIRNSKMYDAKFKLTKKKISVMKANPPIATSNNYLISTAGLDRRLESKTKKIVTSR